MNSEVLNQESVHFRLEKIDSYPLADRAQWHLYDQTTPVFFLYFSRNLQKSYQFSLLLQYKASLGYTP